MEAEGESEADMAPQLAAEVDTEVGGEDAWGAFSEVSFSFPVCDDPQLLLDQPDWFLDQGNGSTTPEIGLYSGLPETPVSIPQDEEEGSLYKLLVLSVGFFFIFSAYNTLGGFVTSILPDGLGDESMLLNSFVQSIAVFAAPGIVATAGEARSMALGSLCYVVYIASLVTGLPMAVLTASALLGLGSSTVWVAQSTYLTRCCPSKLRGAYSGFFFCFYFSSNILGNISAYYAFRALPLTSMFSMYAGVAMVGVLVLLHLPDFPATPPLATTAHPDDAASLAHCSGSESENAEADGASGLDGSAEPVDGQGDSLDGPTEIDLPGSVAPRERSLAGSRMTTLLLYALLAPMSFYTGFEASFWSGQFTKLLPPATIGPVLAATGVGEVVGALGLGLVSDYLGRRTPTFIAGAALFLTGLYLCVPLYEAAKADELLQPTLLGAPVVAYVSGFTFGVGDGVFCGHMFTVISSIFSPEDLEAWALFNLLGTLGSAAAFAYGLAAPLSGPSGSLTQIWTQAGILTIGTVLYVVVDTLLVCWQHGEKVEKKER